MTWTDHIQGDTAVLGGKPVIKGTRLAVDFVLSLRDFGEVVVRGPQKPEAGVLLIRITPSSADDVTRLLVGLLGRTDLSTLLQAKV